MITRYRVIDDTNWQAICGPTHDERLPDGTIVPVRIVDGQKRFLSRAPTENGRKVFAALPKYRDTFPVFPRSEWEARWKEKKERKKRIQDFQKFKPHDQNGLPTCWANGPAHAGTTRRVIDGLPLVYLSACSAAVPISGGHSGGDEADAFELFQKRGAASVDVWSNNDTKRSLDSSSEVAASRLKHKFYQVYYLDTFDEYASASLLDPPMPFGIAYNWWRHVISGGDLELIESGSWGLLNRNNWGDWGDKNDYGYYGYTLMREGRGTPDSGACIGPITLSQT